MIIKKIKGAIIVGICIILATIYMLQRPIPITKELEAVVYTVNDEVHETSISIDGSIKNKLFTEEATYVGDFKIEWYPRSYYDETTAMIGWLSDDAQFIRFKYAGTSSSLDIKDIAIDKTMDNVEILFEDGTIISTQKEAVPHDAEQLLCYFEYHRWSRFVNMSAYYFLQSTVHHREPCPKA